MWQVLSPDPHKRRHLICKCGCGKIKSVAAYDVRSGKSTQCRSCARTTHGCSSVREHRIWEGIIRRCSRPTDTSFKWYGAKGVSVCFSWADAINGYGNFLKDMGKAPTPTSSIDRINNAKGYSKENCRWASRKEQNLNRRTTRWVLVNGVRLCAKDAAAKLGIPYPTFWERLNKGHYKEDLMVLDMREEEEEKEEVA